MHRGLSGGLPTVRQEHFSMIPRQQVPRSTFSTQHSHKTTFQTGYLVPIFVDEVLPGDVFKGEVQIFARPNAFLFPIMDNLELETFWFFVPNRLVWPNWVKLMGEQTNPGDSVSYLVPQVDSNPGGFPICSIYDYMGIPCAGQIAVGNSLAVNALPFRAYNLIWNQWFRDQNLQNSVPQNFGDGNNAQGDFNLLRRNKRHDYFTSCLPWPTKGGTGVSIPLFGMAPVKGIAYSQTVSTLTPAPPGAWNFSETPPFGDVSPVSPSGWPSYLDVHFQADAANKLIFRASPGSAIPRIYADLSQGVGAQLNVIREAVAYQQYLEAQARGGTRYTELLHAIWGVFPEDSRLQRPEYIGGGRSQVQTTAIPQTSATSISGSATPLGALAGQGVVSDRHHFGYHATEHGFILGLVHVGADLTYQQGLPKMWSRRTAADHYNPFFANLGEQPVLKRELYCVGNGPGTEDLDIFGYQERWAEYRHRPSKISGLFRSTSTGNIDEWHLAQQFTGHPTLNDAFIRDNPPMARVLAAAGLADQLQILFDSVFRISCTRAMPVYSVPGLDRF